MTLTYELTEDDAVAAVLHTRRMGINKAAKQKGWRAYVLPLLIPLLIVTGLEISKGPSPIRLLVFLCIWAVIAGLFVAVVTLLNRFVLGIGDTASGMERSARQILARGFMRSNLGPMTAEVVDRGISFRNQHGETLLYNEAVHAILVDDGYVWLMRCKDAVGQIPLRAFASEQQLQAFLRTFKGSHAAAPPTRRFEDARRAAIQPVAL